MELENTYGYKKLKNEVEMDCKRGQNCFNPKGCDNTSFRPKCFHRFCDKFKWVIERAKHYAEKTNLSVDQILDSWEKLRGYCYMNYYQESHQPTIKSDTVRIVDTINEFVASLKNMGFRCPACGHVSKLALECDSSECDWKAYGAFGVMGKGITVFLKETMDTRTIFMPVAWETQEKSIS